LEALTESTGIPMPFLLYRQHHEELVKRVKMQQISGDRRFTPVSEILSFRNFVAIAANDPQTHAAC
jgi:hypothetical protein